MRIVEQLDYSIFQGNPNGLVGFSDIPVFHSKLNTLGIESLHAPMPKSFGKTTPDALAYLYAADRSDHLYNPDHGITRLLSDGSIVMSDRYFYSSIAYQSVECDRDLIERINRFPSPEFLIFIDTPVDECMARIEKRGGEKELFDRAGFLRLVRENYMRQLDALPEGVHLLVVDGTAGIDDVERSVRSFLAPFSL